MQAIKRIGQSAKEEMAGRRPSGASLARRCLARFRDTWQKKVICMYKRSRSAIESRRTQKQGVQTTNDPPQRSSTWKMSMQLYCIMSRFTDTKIIHNSPISQCGLSGMKHSAKKASTGHAAFIKLNVLQSMNVPIRNCVKMPIITARDEVADKKPRRCGCVISATYVKT